MAFEFKFPDVGEGIHEGRIVEWMVAEGDTVAVDQPFVKVETDKAVVELPAPVAGTVLKLHFEKDAVIRVGQVMVTFGAAGEQPSSRTSHEIPRSDPTNVQRAARDDAPASAPRSALSTLNSQLSTVPSRPLATPHTRALARKLGVDLAGVRGTGPRGRITDEDAQRAASPATPVKRETSDVKREITASVSHFASRISPGSSATDEPVERVPVSYLRKRIAEHMTASKTISAHVTHVDEADVTELHALYRQAKGDVKDAYGLNLTILPFFMKALVETLREHPLFNASYDEEKGELIYKKFCNIGIAMDTPEGLIVPVVKNVEQKNMLTLATELQALGEKARSRTLSLEELKGATITITNIGPIGGLFATPIINQPNLAIVALGAIQDRPVAHEGAVVIRKMIYLSVSFDHRVIDGAEAARFVNALVRIVSKPGLLMAGV